MSAPKLEFLMTEAKILDEIVVDEKTGDKVIRAEVKWQQAENINVNNRRYRRGLLEREIASLLPAVKAKEVYGCSYHPKDGIGDTHEVTHLWENIWMNEKGECLGVVKVLPTSRGKDIQVIMRHGKVGMSSRGAGTTTMMTDVVENEKKTFEEVNDDFRLKVPGDFVLYPSVPDAGVRQLMESQLECTVDPKSIKENEDMDIKTKDELKAAFPELLKQVEEDAAAVVRSAMESEIEKAVEEAHAEWQKDMATALDERLAPLVKHHDGMIESLRAIVAQLADIEGVVPVDEEAIDEQPPADGEEEPAADDEEGDTIETVADLKAAFPELCKQLEDEAKGKKEAAEPEAKVAEAEAPVAETPEEKKKRLEKEKADAETEAAKAEAAAADEKAKLDEAVKAEAEAKALAESAAKVEAVKEKIVASGLEERGTITNPDISVAALTEDQKLRFFKEARLAGFAGSLTEWTSLRAGK